MITTPKTVITREDTAPQADKNRNMQKRTLTALDGKDTSCE